MAHPSRSESVLASNSILCRLSLPVSWVRVEVPTFTTTRRQCFPFHHLNAPAVTKNPIPLLPHHSTSAGKEEGVKLNGKIFAVSL